MQNKCRNNRELPVWLWLNLNFYLYNKRTTDLTNSPKSPGTCQCPVSLALWHLVIRWHAPDLQKLVWYSRLSATPNPMGLIYHQCFHYTELWCVFIFYHSFTSILFHPLQDFKIGPLLRLAQTVTEEFHHPIEFTSSSSKPASFLEVSKYSPCIC